MDAISRAVEAAGGQSNLAKALGVTPQQVNQWVLGTRPVPPARCIAIEDATKGAVTRYELRPDVFGIKPLRTRAA